VVVSKNDLVKKPEVFSGKGPWCPHVTLDNWEIMKMNMNKIIGAKC
jgi:hypothetical protein